MKRWMIALFVALFCMPLVPGCSVDADDDDDDAKVKIDNDGDTKSIEIDKD